MCFTNISDSDILRVVTNDMFEVIDGDPKFNRDYAEFNAREMSEEWIKHTYRDGWLLPEMPGD